MNQVVLHDSEFFASLAVAWADSKSINAALIRYVRRQGICPLSESVNRRCRQAHQAYEHSIKLFGVQIQLDLDRLHAEF
jgi:hypothetical protein